MARRGGKAGRGANKGRGAGTRPGGSGCCVGMCSVCVCVVVMVVVRACLSWGWDGMGSSLCVLCG